MFLLWSDPKAAPAARIAGALAAFAARYGVPATLALVAAGEAAPRALSRPRPAGGVTTLRRMVHALGDRPAGNS